MGQRSREDALSAYEAGFRIRATGWHAVAAVPPCVLTLAQDIESG